MPTENGDVKTTEASSASASASASKQTSDGIEQSSSSNTKSGNDVKSGQSMSDFVKQTLEQKGQIESQVEDKGNGEKEEKSDSENELDAEKEKETGDEKEEVTGKEEDDEKKKDGEESGEEEGEESTDGDDKEKKPVPYDRFQEVIAEKNKATKEVGTYKPRAENFDRIANFCRENQIDAKSFESALEIQALISSGNREEALKRLMPVVDGLRMSTGDSLPADIQAKVDQGKLELEDAKEIAKLRAQNKFGQLTSRQQQEQQQKQAEEEQGRRLQSAANDWEQRKQKSDPDYKPKTKDTQPDGKWEDVRDKYLAMLNLTNEKGQFLNPVRNEKEMTDLMERAYTQVSAKYQHLTKRPATRKSLSSNGSSTTSGNKTIEEAKTMQEAISIALAGRTQR